MIEVYGIILIMTMYFAASKSQILEPEVVYDLTGSGPIDLRCRDASNDELAAADMLPKGKASTFHVQGFFRCERPIFEYGRRNSYIDFVTKSTTAHANFIAQKVASLMTPEITQDLIQKTNNTTTYTRTLALEIETDSDVSALKPYLTSVYTDALTNHLGPERVLKLPRNGAITHQGSSSPVALLHIKVNRVDESKSLFTVTFKHPGLTSQVWIEI